MLHALWRHDWTTSLMTHHGSSPLVVHRGSHMAMVHHGKCNFQSEMFDFSTKCFQVKHFGFQRKTESCLVLGCLIEKLKNTGENQFSQNPPKTLVENPIFLWQIVLMENVWPALGGGFGDMKTSPLGTSLSPWITFTWATKQPSGSVFFGHYHSVLGG